MDVQSSKLSILEKLTSAETKRKSICNSLLRWVFWNRGKTPLSLTRACCSLHRCLKSWGRPTHYMLKKTGEARLLHLILSWLRMRSRCLMMFFVVFYWYSWNIMVRGFKIEHRKPLSKTFPINYFQYHYLKVILWIKAVWFWQFLGYFIYCFTVFLMYNLKSSIYHFIILSRKIPLIISDRSTFSSGLTKVVISSTQKKAWNHKQKRLLGIALYRIWNQL